MGGQPLKGNKDKREYAEQEKRNGSFRPAAKTLRGRELRFFFAFCAVVILAAVLFHQHNTLRRPVFLKMDREETMAEEKGISVYYIQDQEDTSRITAVEFPELEGIGEFQVREGMKEEAWSLFSSYYRSGFQGEKYGIYEIYGQIRIPQEQWPREGITLRRIRVSYEDGTVAEEDIGKLHLRVLEDSGIMEGRSASTSSDGTESSTYRIRQDCRLEQITAENPEQLRQEMEIRINGTDLWQGAPAELKKGDYLEIETIRKSDRTAVQSLEPMTAFLEFQFTEAGMEGEIQRSYVPIQRFLYLRKDRFQTIRRYLKERGAYESGH